MAKDKKELVAAPAPTNALQLQVVEEQNKREILAHYVKKNMVEGTDFYTLKIGGRETKPSLSKPGSEKVLSLFHWRVEFVRDNDTWGMLGNPAGVLCYIAKIYNIKDNLLIGEGRGARDVKKDGGDINKAIKMAEKSAQIDAVMRTGGLSDLFTQDIEDMVNYDTTPVPTRAPVQVSGVDNIDDPREYDDPKLAPKKAADLEGSPDSPATIKKQRKEIQALLIALSPKPPETKAEYETACMELTGLKLEQWNYKEIIEALKEQYEEKENN